VGDDPVDGLDPLGLKPWYDRLENAGGALLNKLRTPSQYNPLYDVVNTVAILPYGAYYFSYRTLSSVGSIPVVGKALTFTPFFVGLYATEYLGLKTDEGIDIFKNSVFCNGESAADEGGPIYPTSIHAGPEIYGPGVHPNGRQDLYPSHSYPWWDGFSPNRDPNAG
jgi:hypothetical protein